METAWWPKSGCAVFYHYRKVEEIPLTSLWAERYTKMAHTPYEVRLFTDPETLSTVVLESDYAELKAVNTDLLKALREFVDAAQEWHDFHRHDAGIQCDRICAAIAPGRSTIRNATQEGPNATRS